MKRSNLTGQRLVAVFLMGCVLLDYPILSLFDRPVSVAGVPLLWVYVFGAWALVIALMAWIIERPRG